MSLFNTQKERTIQVFISSTFTDMKEEREELVKHVFPQLKQICDKRNVSWSEVDLRWGITDEQKAEGHVLSICLDEINRCRPYFIGILGEKYGSIPETISGDLMESQSWLSEYPDCSVTELEILHGVLNNVKIAEHAHFYFRDPQYSGTQYETDDGKIEKLRSLKERIRSSGLPVRENYTDPRALGELVFRDLSALIEKLFPDGSLLDPLQKEASDHESLARQKSQLYIERKGYSTALDRFVKSSTQPLIVTGEPGSGKTSMLSHWVLEYRRKYPDKFIIMHFVGGTQHSSDLPAILRRIMSEIKQRYGLEQIIPEEPEKISIAFASWLHLAAVRGRLVLIIDGLNQLEDTTRLGNLAWLPSVIQENIRLILSTTDEIQLSELKKRHWNYLEVKLLDDNERKQLIIDYLGQYRKCLSNERISKITSVEQTRNPLYLCSFLEELRIFGEIAQLDEHIDYYLSAKTVPGLFVKMIDRFEEDYDRERPELVRDTMTLIWASRRGISEHELLAILGNKDQPLPRALWAPFLMILSKFTINRSGLIGFSHFYMRKAVEGRYLPTYADQQYTHLRLADYFETQKLNPRVVDELPWQLSEAKSWRRLRELFSNLEFFRMSWQWNHFELKRFWTKLEDVASFSITDVYSDAMEMVDDRIFDPAMPYLASFFFDKGYIHEALTIWQFLALHYQGTNDRKKYAQCLGRQAKALGILGHIGRKNAMFKEQEKICIEINDLRGLQENLYGQAKNFWKLGDHKNSLAILYRQEKICRDIGDLALIQQSLGYQAKLMLLLGDLEKALSLLKSQEQMCRMIGETKGLVISLVHQSKIHYEFGDLDIARKLVESAMALCRDIGDPFSLSWCHGMMGQIILAEGYPDQALEFHRKDEDICRRTANKIGLYHALGNLIDVFRALGNLEEALKCLKEQEELSKLLDSSDNYLLNRALLLMDQGLFAESYALFNSQVTNNRKSGLPKYLANILYKRGELLSLMGRVKEAKSDLFEAHQIASEHGFIRLSVEIKKAQHKLSPFGF